MDEVNSVFGKPLEVDPTIALKPCPISNGVITPRPMRRVEYVIEIVGPRTVAAGSAQAVLRPDWQSALGNPTAYVMSQSDTEWRLLTQNDSATVYDSLCLTWPLMSPKGTLSSASARQLLQTAESLANQLSRRAIPLTPPEDIDHQVSDLQKISSQLDVGVGFSLVSPTGAIYEADVWQVCAALGFDLDGGYFVWTIPGWEAPLFSLCSLGNIETFSLQAVKARVAHPALSIGFSVPRCPNVIGTFDAMLHVADIFRTKAGLVAQDEDGRTVDSRVAQDIRMTLQEAEKALRRVGFSPGSPESLILFTES